MVTVLLAEQEALDIYSLTGLTSQQFQPITGIIHQFWVLMVGENTGTDEWYMSVPVSM